MKDTYEEKINEEMLIIRHGLKQGYSLKEIYDTLNQKYGTTGGILLSEYVKREKEKGNTKLFEEFMRTYFI